MDKSTAIKAGRNIAKGFGIKDLHWLVIAENTRTGNHYVLGGYPTIGQANKARGRFEKEYRTNPFGPQPYMRVTVEEA